MRPLSIRLQNTYSHEDSFLNLRNKKLALIVGEVNGEGGRSNTAGKSSIFSAMEFCLFGTTRSGPKLVVRDGEKDCRVVLVFRGDDGHAYKVERSIKLLKNNSVSTELAFYYSKDNSWIRKDHETRKDRIGLQEEIQKIVGMDAEVFRQSVRFQHQDIGAFPLAKPSERRQVLKKFVDLHVWDDLETIEKERVKQTKNELDTQRKVSIELEARLEDPLPVQEKLLSIEKDISLLVEDKAEFGNKLSIAETRLGRAKEVFGFTKKVADLTAEEKTLVDLGQHLENNRVSTKEGFQKELDDFKARAAAEEVLKTRVLQIEEIFSKEKTNQDDLAKTRDAVKAFSVDVIAAQQQVSLYQANIQSIGDQKRSIQGIEGPCPTCLHPVDKEHKEHVFGSLKTNYEALKIKRDSSMVILNDLTDKLALEQKKENELYRQLSINPGLRMELTNVQRQIGDIDSDRTRLNKKKAYVTECLKDIALKKSQTTEHLERVVSSLKEAQQALSLVEEDGRQLPQLEKQCFDLKASIEQLDIKVSSLQKQLGEYNERLRTIFSLKKEVELRKAAIDNLQNTYNIQKQVEKAFGKQGVQAVILENSLYFFEATARKYLKRFTAGVYDIKIDTTASNNSNDNIREVLDIMIDKGNGIWHPYESFSGSETTKIDFAIRVALALLSASFSSVRPESLYIDEVAGCLDSYGRKDFMEMLVELSKDFDLILVVTHHPELQDEFREVITVRKKGFVSNIMDADQPEAEDLYTYTKDTRSAPIPTTIGPPEVDNDFYLAGE